MNKTRHFASKLILASLLVAVGSSASAQVDQSTNAMDVIELEKVTVMGEQLTREQELSLRVIKIGLQNERSSRAEDANEVVCWFDNPTGTLMQHLYCGTNWALDSKRGKALGQWSQYKRAVNPMAGGPVYAVATRPRTNENYYVSARPVDPGFVKEVMQNLGPVALNREIVNRALEGEQLPDNVPTERELNAFVDAYLAVRNIRSSYNPRLAELNGQARRSLQGQADEKMSKAIDSAGLSVERYNEISAMAEEYQSLRTYLADHLASR